MSPMIIQANPDPSIMANAPAVPSLVQYNPLFIGRYQYSTPIPASTAKKNIAQSENRVGALNISNVGTYLYNHG
ncbi:unnamed protein product, partial [marine sediment metagenome]